MVPRVYGFYDGPGCRLGLPLGYGRTMQLTVRVQKAAKELLRREARRFLQCRKARKVGIFACSACL